MSHHLIIWFIMERLIVVETRSASDGARTCVCEDRTTMATSSPTISRNCGSMSSVRHAYGEIVRAETWRVALTFTRGCSEGVATLTSRLIG